MGNDSTVLDTEQFTDAVSAAVTQGVDDEVDELASQRAQQIQIHFERNGEGTLHCELGNFNCLGHPGRKYPKDITIWPHDKKGTHHSKEFNVDMPYAILIWGQRGIYIHEGPANLRENGGPSAGCIHLGTGDASRVYNWVTGRTRIRISYPW